MHFRLYCDPVDRTECFWLSLNWVVIYQKKISPDVPCCFSAVKLDLLCSKWRTTAHLAFNSKACQTWQAPDGRIEEEEEKKQTKKGKKHSWQMPASHVLMTCQRNKRSASLVVWVPLCANCSDDITGKFTSLTCLARCKSLILMWCKPWQWDFSTIETMT